MFDLSHTISDRPLVALQQSDLWAQACRKLGSEAHREQIGPAQALVLRNRLPIVGGMALISRANLHLSPDQAADLRTQLEVRHLVINAETTGDAYSFAAAGFHRIAVPRMVAELNLSPSTDVMAARLSPKWRNRLRHGQSQGLHLTRRPMHADPRHWLLRAETKQSARLWYRPLPPEMIAALAACKTGAAQVFTAHHLGQRVAAMLFLRHGRDATYQIGWSTDEGRTRSAGPALMWRAMVDLQQLGVERIDLGAADPEHAPGLAHFKRGTGADLRPLGGTWLDTSWSRRKGNAARKRALNALRGAQHRHILSAVGPLWTQA